MSGGVVIALSAAGGASLTLPRVRESIAVAAKVARGARRADFATGLTARTFRECGVPIVGDLTHVTFPGN